MYHERNVQILIILSDIVTEMKFDDVHEVIMLFDKIDVTLQELVYVWNGFSILGKREELVDPVLTIVESTINTILKGSGKSTTVVRSHG